MVTGGRNGIYRICLRSITTAAVCTALGPCPEVQSIIVWPT